MPGSDDSDNMMLFGGVYAAIQDRLVIGPYTHAENFVTAPGASKFAGMTLPPPEKRYLVSCLLPTSALPAASSVPPRGTTTSSPQSTPRLGSASQSSTGATPRGDSSSTGTPAAEGSQAAAASTSADTKALVAQSQSAAADFIAQMQARRQQRQLQSVRTTNATTGMPLAFSRSVEKARSRRADQAGLGATAHGAPESTVRRLAQENDDIVRATHDVLGDERFLQCAMTQETLEETHDVQEAVEFIQAALKADPASMVYVYSGSGRNRASALAMYYLQRSDKLLLRDILPRLPTSTPRISYLRSLIQRDKQMTADGKASFDEAAYYLMYFTRRYPNKTPAMIKAAVETCPGDFQAMDKLLHDEYVFASAGVRVSTTTGVAGSRNGTSSGGAIKGSLSRNTSFSSRATATNEPQSAPFTPMPSTMSFGTVGEGSAPLTLTALDDEIIDSICNALHRANVPTSRDDVTESYTRNRRNRTKVLRECLGKGGVKGAATYNLDSLRTPVVSPQRSHVSSEEAA